MQNKENLRLCFYYFEIKCHKKKTKTVIFTLIQLTFSVILNFCKLSLILCYFFFLEKKSCKSKKSRWKLCNVPTTSQLIFGKKKQGEK